MKLDQVVKGKLEMNVIMSHSLTFICFFMPMLMYE